MSQNRKVDAVIYIGNYQFPMGEAVAKRALGLGKAFSYAGYRVLFIDENASVPLGEISEVKRYEEFEYCSIHHSTSSIEHYQYHKDLKKIKKQILNWRDQYEIRAIILCGTKCAFLANGIINYAKKEHIPVFADSMDWLTSHTGNFLFDILKQFDTTFEIKVVNGKVDGVICISEYLATYYNSKKKKTLVIPPLSPYNRPKSVDSRSKRTKIIYAGIPCRLGKELLNPSDAKDRLDLAIQLLYELSKDGVDFEFVIYGLKKEDYDIVFPRQRMATDYLVKEKRLFFMGKQDESVVKTAVIASDFTILLRENNRTSMAGFPTKVSESITLGTPVITTDTSDILKYLKDKTGCCFLDLQNWHEAREQLKQALSSDADDRYKRKLLALQNNSFSPDNYASVLGRFIKGDEDGIGI